MNNKYEQCCVGYEDFTEEKIKSFPLIACGWEGSVGIMEGDIMIWVKGEDILVIPYDEMCNEYKKIGVGGSLDLAILIVNLAHNFGCVGIHKILPIMGFSKC